MSKLDELIAQMQARIDEQAREIERLEDGRKLLARDLAASLKQQCADIRTIHALKAQPSGVVAPGCVSIHGDLLKDLRKAIHKDWHATIDAVLNGLNSSPVSAGGVDDRAAFEEAALAMWGSEANMDNEAADAEVALSSAALSAKP